MLSAQEVDARRVISALLKQWFDCMVAVNQVAVVTLDVGLALVARVAAVNTLDDQQRAEAIVYHCFRGRCTPNTAVYVSMAGQAADEAALSMQLQRHSLCKDTNNNVDKAAFVCLTHQRYVPRGGYMHHNRWFRICLSFFWGGSCVRVCTRAKPLN